MLDKAELISMVGTTQMHNTYKHTLRSSPNSEVSDGEGAVEGRESQFSPRASLFTTEMSRRLDRKSSAALIKRDDFSSKGKVEAYVEKILIDVKAEETLDFDKFVKFVETHPRIMEVFTATFREEMWSTAKVTAELAAYTRTYRKKRHCSCCFLPSQKASIRITTTHATIHSVSTAQEKAGWLTSKASTGTGIAEKVYAALKNGMLLVYQSSQAVMPNSVIFLEGCYIEPIENHGFEITHQFGGFRAVCFWCLSEEERKEWVQKLVQSAKARKIEEYYEFKDKIGTGRFSDVYVGLEISSQLQWAIKVVEKKRLNEQEREMMRSEVAIMRLLNHNNVVQLKEVFEDKQKMYLIMELVEGGELFDRIRKKKVFSEFTAFFITRQLLDTVKYLHDVGIVHRDIKPENILLTDDSEIPTVKLADFGLSRLVGPTDMLRSACGTLAYVAPEVLMQRPYGKPVDVWSVGIVTYLMLRGRLPFDSKERQLIIQRTIEAELDVNGSYWDKFTPYVIDFLQKLIEKDPNLRLTVDQALLHSWIRNGDILIPRKINKHTMEDELLRKTLTSSKVKSQIYEENPKHMTLEPPGSEDGSARVIYTTPELYEDMEVTRHQAEQSLVISLLP